MKFPRTLNPYFEIAAIFVAALFVRVVFNLSLESRLCHFGDAFYFLTSGAQLLAAVKSGMLAQLAAAHPQATAGVNAMMSLSLVDRILIDGPVFPSYLALVQFAVGLNPAAPQFDSHSLQIAMCNSVLDALACVLIYQMTRLAFDRTAGRIAGVLSAFYPAAIINTASCYSEPFAYFMVALFLATLFATQLRHTNKVVSHLLAFALGVCAALLMLAKPVFVALPLLTFVVAGALSTHWSIRKFLPTAITTLLGLTLTLAPWLAFTGMVTGKSSIVVNRYPAFNFMMGNRLESDGWREYPLPYIPTEMSEAIKVVRADFNREPLRFASMELRKVLRLWAGSWNNFELTFVLPPDWQDRVHQFLLVAGFLGFVAAISYNKLRSRIGRSAIILGIIPLFHCVYLMFEPQSRYAFPAMPAVIALAALAISALWRPGMSLRPRGVLANGIMAVAVTVMIGVFAAEAAFHPDRYERVLPGQQATRTINWTEQQPRDGYVLVDAKPGTLSQLTLNGAELTGRVPFWQLNGNTGELINAMSVQSAGMGKPIQQFRQWWAFPGRLNPGENKVAATGTIYGDDSAAYSGGTVWMPALETGSWTRAFTTIYRGEPRVYTNVPFAGTATAPMPRIFFIPAEQRSASAGTIVQLVAAPKTILGADPLSYSLTAQPVPLRGANRFRFTADVHSPNRNASGFVSVAFTGTVEGKPKHWSSPWQPTRLATNQTWTFEDQIPADIAAAPDAGVTVIASPFSADLLFLNKKAALKRSMTVKSARLELYAPGAYPAPLESVKLY